MLIDMCSPDMTMDQINRIMLASGLLLLPDKFLAGTLPHVSPLWVKSFESKDSNEARKWSGGSKLRVEGTLLKLSDFEPEVSDTQAVDGGDGSKCAGQVTSTS